MTEPLTRFATEEQDDVKVCGDEGDDDAWLGGHAETELDGSSDLRKSDGGPSTLAESRATMVV